MTIASSLIGFVVLSLAEPAPPPAADASPPPGYPPANYPPAGYPPPVYPPPGYTPPQGIGVTPAPAPEKRLGVGYKIGNGLGFVGADIIIAPINHLAFDLQANYLSVSDPDGTVTGYGFAPSVQGRLFAGQVSTPYIGAGALYLQLSRREITATGKGFFFNLGYEWRWDSGLGIILGGGLSHLSNVHATNGIETLDRSGGTRFNLEVGLRWMFL